MIFSYSRINAYEFVLEKVILELDEIILNISLKNSNEEYILSCKFREHKINISRNGWGAINLLEVMGDYELY